MDSVKYLLSEIKYLKGVGPALGAIISKLGIKTFVDLLFHLPVSAIDRKLSSRIPNTSENITITLKIKILSHPAGTKARFFPYRVATETEDGSYLEIVYFNGKAAIFKSSLPVGEWRIISGKLERYGSKIQIAHPDFIVKLNEEAKISRIQPVYPLTEGISQNKIASLIAKALEGLKSLPEWANAEYIKKNNWPAFADAIKQVHSPASVDDINPLLPARMRLAYDECLANQVALQLSRKNVVKEVVTPLKHRFELAAKVIAGLPFKLTKAQNKALHEIAQDMKSGNKMARLLQGDVGSGKTAVALVACTFVVEAGQQAAIMVPTSILSNQQYGWIAGIAEKHGIKTILLTGSDKGRERATKLEAIKTGEAKIIVGTHALFQEDIKFHNLGLAIADEQHRFGVEQRLQLFEKGNCHVLFMSATPIPRTLTMAVYGDLDLTIMNEKPAGRKPIETRVLPLERLDEVVEAVKRAIKSGNRIYWICPLVEESEKVDISAAEDRFRILQKEFGESVALVHGRMKHEERTKKVDAFARGKYSILVATTVIEVGVNVPEATIMIIEYAERFGLSQLHQLRGRVGRGEKQSSCLLLYGKGLSENGIKRLKIMRETDDGFRIAEEDLKIRGSGDILGTRQSGIVDFRLTDISAHSDLIAAAHDDAKHALNNDPHLTSDRGKALHTLLKLFGKSEYAKFANG